MFTMISKMYNTEWERESEWMNIGISHQAQKRLYYPHDTEKKATIIFMIDRFADERTDRRIDGRTDWPTYQNHSIAT